MRLRSAAIAGAAILAFAAAGCGGTAAVSSQSQPAKTQQTAPAQTAQQAGTGYYDMNQLAAAYTTEYNAKGEPLISDVTCMLTGPQTALAMGTLDTGEDWTQVVHISADGLHWMSNGSEDN